MPPNVVRVFLIHQKPQDFERLRDIPQSTAIPEKGGINQPQNPPCYLLKISSFATYRIIILIQHCL